MPDREHDELERELRELGSRIDYPPTPDISRTVKLRLEAGDTEHPRRRRWPRMLARPGWAAAAAATVLLSLSILSPAMRSTFSDIVSAGASSGAGGAAGGADQAGVDEEAPASSAEYSTEELSPPADEVTEATEPSSGAAATGASAASSPREALGLGARIPPSEASPRGGGYFCRSRGSSAARGRSTQPAPMRRTASWWSSDRDPAYRPSAARMRP